MNSSPKVSAIVLNWNGKEVIEACLESLLKQAYPSLEIIVVDNGSKDGSLEMIQKKYGPNPLIKMIVNQKNLGFAEGCNVGMRASSGEYIVLVNSDATLEPNWTSEMLKGFDYAPNVGMVAGKIYFAGSDEKRIENTGHIVYRDGLSRGRGRLEKDLGQYDKPGFIFCPNGCAAMYRKSLMEAVDMFDKEFFAYADDIDVGFRGRLLGFECAYVPTAVAYHKLSASFGMLSPFKAFLLERNRLWVVIKCFPFWHMIISPYFTVVRYAYHFYGVLQHMGPASRYAEKISVWSLAWIALKVYLSTIKYLPHLIWERRKVRSHSKVSTKEFETWLRKYGMTAREVALNEISY